MNPPTAPTKEALRQQLRKEASRHDVPELERESSRMCTVIAAQPIWKSAKSILFFWPVPGEPNLLALCREAIKSGKIVAFPKFQGSSGGYTPVQVSDLERDMAAGQFGIPEPVSGALTLKVLDLIFVPGVGFSFAGVRLGRGKGYYDRLLSTISGIKCGVAFDWQIAAELPSEAHDIRLDCVVTPSQWRNVSDQPAK